MANHLEQRIKLSVLVGTYNRLELLKKCVTSILNEVQSLTSPALIYVVDAGSTDGTLEYLRSINSPQIKIVEDGQRLGQAKSFNRVLKELDCDFVCWLSDDNELVPGAFSTALKILNENSKIGMVGLKVKDTEGPNTKVAYVGGVWDSGIFNINQGVLRFDLFNQIGFFDETYGSYAIDSDLTTRILVSGFKVCLTKRIFVLHHRMHFEMPGAFASTQVRAGQFSNAQDIYSSKFAPLISANQSSFARWISLRAWDLYHVIEKSSLGSAAIRRLAKLTWVKGRDIQNILKSKWISKFDLLINIGKPYYLVQSIDFPKLKTRDHSESAS